MCGCRQHLASAGSDSGAQSVMYALALLRAQTLLVLYARCMFCSRMVCFCMRMLSVLCLRIRVVCLVSAPSVYRLHVHDVCVCMRVVCIVSRMICCVCACSALCEHALLCMCILSFACALSVLYAHDPLCMHMLFFVCA